MSGPADERPYRYRGLSARSYDTLVPPPGDEAFFREAIRRFGEPVLDVGCGTGRLLVPFAASGIDVEGVDDSPEMLEICRAKARARGLEPALHVQPMQRLDLPRRYRTLFVPAGSFELLRHPGDVDAALRGFFAHLEVGGAALVPLSLPHVLEGVTESGTGEWRVRREAVRPEDGATLRAHERVTWDLERQERLAPIRLEAVKDGTVLERQELRLDIRWHSQAQFRALLRDAGFAEIEMLRGDWCAADPDAPYFVALGRRTAF